MSRSRRVKTPTVLQMEAVECGAAALAIVLRHYGRAVSLEELRIACDVSRDGTKASNIVAAARTHGMKAKGFRKTPETIRALRMPLIIHWNFNHFLVLEGFRGRKVFLNDPAHGRYYVTFDEFDQAFTGVVLALEPGPDFQRVKDTRGLLASLWPRIRTSKAALSFVILASLGLVIPGLVIPTLTTVFIDQYLVRHMRDWVLPVLLLMALIMLFNTGFTWLQQRYLLRLETKLSVSTSSAFLWHILHLPIEFFNHRSPGEIGSRVAINDRVASLVSGELASTVLSVLTAVFFLGLMLLYDVVLTVVTVGMAALNILGLVLVSRRLVDGNRRVLQDHGKLVGETMSGLRMVETMKATAAESDFFAKWSGQFVKAINTRQQLGTSMSALGAFPSLLQALNVTAILTVGSLRVMDGELTIGMLIAFQYLVASFLGPVNHLVDVGGLLQQTVGDMNRLDDVLRYRKAPNAGNGAGAENGAGERPKLSGQLELRGVEFGYSRLAEPLFADFSMRLEPGAWVALVGGSGCGKSTVAKLVAGLYEPWSGDILFDGRPRRSYSRAVLSNSLAVVDQEILLFNDTMEANLTLWDVSLPHEQLVQAARDACIHDFIATRKGEYAAMVAEGGANMSGGQRQRVEIARALAMNPTLLVLDEATSALDPTTERRVMENLRRRGCACLVVAHRLSTIRDCDEIIVLDHGAVVERGSHRDLIGAGGFYANLISVE